MRYHRLTQWSMLLLLASLILMTPVVKAALFIPTITVQVPDDRVYEPGQSIAINWNITHEGILQRRPVFIYLADKNSRQRRMIAAVNNSKSGYNWKIPDDLLENFNATDGSTFKLIFSTRVNGKIARRFSRYFQIRPTAPIEDPMEGPIEGPIGEMDEQLIDFPDVSAPEPENVTLNGNLTYVGRYTFNATYEAWEVRKLTVVNDSENDGFEADPNEHASSIQRVYATYKNEGEDQVYHSAEYVNNQATLSGMDLTIPRKSSNHVDIWAEVTSDLDGEDSGQSFRLGIQEVNNSSSTFEAIGLASSTKDTTMSNVSFSTAQSPEEFVVRKSVPLFEVSGAEERNLINGQNTVYELKVNADESGSIALGRLVFDVYQVGLTAVDNVQVYKGSSRLTAGTASDDGQVYVMWDAGASSCFANERQSGAGTGMNCNGAVQDSSKLIVAFTQEQNFSSTQTFKIKMDVSGATTNSYLSIRLNEGDDNAEANIGGTVSNTGQIYSGTGTNELFANADDYATEATAITDRNIIWSDLSAIPHRYPTFAAGASPTTSTTSSEDFTNGYLLKVGSLPSVTLRTP